MDALPAYMSEEDLALWLIWGQTAEDRAALAEWKAECARVLDDVQHAREIEATDTRELDLATTDTGPAVVLFPIWQAEKPLETAIQVAVARAYLEAA